MTDNKHLKIKIMKTLSMIVLSLLSVCANAQKITGRITNVETGEPVPYANVLVVGKNLHTVSDLNGNFTVPVSRDIDTCILRFSSIGYEKHIVKLVHNNIHKMNRESVAISLSPKVYQIPEVVIYAQQLNIARINPIKWKIE